MLCGVGFFAKEFADKRNSGDQVDRLYKHIKAMRTLKLPDRKYIKQAFPTAEWIRSEPFKAEPTFPSRLFIGRHVSLRLKFSQPW